MSLEDIDNLPITVSQNDSGHIEDTNKIIGGLKTLKSLTQSNQTTLDSKYQKPSGGIPTADIANSSVTDAKLAGSISPSKITGTAVINNDSRLSDQRVPTNNSVTIAKISATGSASSTTYLRGDGTWAEPPTGGGGGSGTVTSANITDASTIGRSILTGADASSIRNTLGAASNILSGYSSTTGTVAATDTIVQAIGKLNGNSAGKAPISHTHAISDLTATGTKDSTTFLRGDGTWATPSVTGSANVELAYAEVATKIPLGSNSAFEDAPGLAITFEPGSRPAMVDAYLATVAAFNSATWGFRVVRVSDNRVMAEGVCNTTSAVGYPPSPQLRFRVAAGAASATYKVQTCLWEGTAPGELNAQAEAGSGHRAYISAVSV